MSLDLRRQLFAEIDSWELTDPHTHINPQAPAAQNLADILGYHYYTELAHSAGLPREQIEDPQLDPPEKVRRILEYLPALDNTIQVSWLVEMAREFFGWDESTIRPADWRRLYDRAQTALDRPDWASVVLKRSKLTGVFLTNDFDDPLTGFDTATYIPCLRTDDLVFHLTRESIRKRLEVVNGGSLSRTSGLTAALNDLFSHFVGKGARACAISLPPDFSPSRVAGRAAEESLGVVLSRGSAAPREDRETVSQLVFWSIAELADVWSLPFDLMIGVNRAVYPGGVQQGQDLYDSRVSLWQYRELFNAFPKVTFPISVLASVTNQELTSYSWIFPNVVTHGHWWYSNTPAFIEHDLAARLEAVPRSKQIAYYSDMYKLEFALPKFRMFKRVLAKVLAERFIGDRGWTESQALQLARQVLVENTSRIFPAR